ncbi:ABC transporter permease [Haliscomenobacter sp.]|uniref:ABC transporter permease n=1 Tax=Haliscomenobacter sp. TaxID=2717303 RepID=UPI003BAC13F2
MLQNYLKITWRNLRRNRVYALLNVVGLSLGIGCGLLVFWFIRFHTTHDAFHKDIDRVYQVTTEFHFDGTSYSRGVPPPTWKAVRDETSATAATICIEGYEKLMALIDANGRPAKKFKEGPGPKLAYVAPSYFKVFDYEWQVGSAKSLAKPNTLVISKRMAEKYFGDEDPIGRIIKLENELNLEVTGIVNDPPDNTDLPYEFFVSFATLENNKDFVYGGPELTTWSGVNSNTYCFALLPPEVTAARFQKEIDAISKKYHGKDYKAYAHPIIKFREIHHSERYYGPVPYKWIYIMGTIGIFLIATACFNFINMATAQAMRRAKEVGIRKAVGGQRGQVFFQFIAETGVITAVALVLGFAMATFALPSLNKWLNLGGGWPSHVSWNDTMLWVFIITLFLTVVFLAGSYPGLILAGFRPVVALKGGINQQQAGGLNIRRSLIVVQFVLIQLLVICTLVINGQVDFMMNKPIGYETKGIVEITIPTPEKINQTTFRERLLSIPGVKDASFFLFSPTTNSNNTTNFRFDTRQKDEIWQMNTKNADHHYIETYGLTLVAGKNIPPSDTVQGYLVNEKVVERLGVKNPEDIIGKKLRVWGIDAPIYGVLKNWNNASFEQEIAPIAVFTYKDIHYNCGLRLSSNNLQKTMKEVEKLWNSYFPDHLYEQSFLDESIARNYEFVRTMLRLVQIFSLIAIFIGCLGLYGLVKFMAVQKTKEIGVRKVLGANLAQILGLFGKEISFLVGIAFLVAAPLGWYLMNAWLQDYTYRIPIGFGTLVFAVFITLGVALLTSSYESIKAALVNPAKSLKSE